MIFTDINKLLSRAGGKLRDAAEGLKSLNVPVKCTRSCHTDFIGKRKRMRIGASMDCDVCLCDLLIAAVGFSIAAYFLARLAHHGSKAQRRTSE